MPSRFSIAPRTIDAECLCIALRRAARSVARRYDDALRPWDLSNGQFSMLVVIAGRQPIAIQAVADHLAMDRTTVTAALKPLQRRGLVDVEVSARDARGREVQLSARGTSLLSNAMPVWEGVQKTFDGHLSPTGMTRLRKQLSQLD